MNVLLLAGYVGQPPEKKVLPNGTETAKFSLATSKNWKDKSGEKKQKTTWHNLVVYGARVGFVMDYVKKGAFLVVQGEQENSSYEQDGVKKYFSSVNVSDIQLVGKSDQGEQPTGSTSQVRADKEQLDEDFSIPF